MPLVLIVTRERAEKSRPQEVICTSFRDAVNKAIACSGGSRAEQSELVKNLSKFSFSPLPASDGCVEIIGGWKCQSGTRL